MNFFGHAAVATWAETEPQFVLGAMLPDFESMLRGKVSRLPSTQAQRGVAFHHQTDDAFHRRPAFVQLCTSTLDALSSLGVRRGTCRAVAHLGSEMFLDGHLASTPQYADAYRAALDVSGALGGSWTVHDDAVHRFFSRLTNWGPPVDYAEPAFVLARLKDALEGRARLQIEAQDEPEIEAFLPELQSRVVNSAPELLTDLRNALGL